MISDPQLHHTHFPLPTVFFRFMPTMRVLTVFSKGFPSFTPSDKRHNSEYCYPLRSTPMRSGLGPSPKSPNKSRFIFRPCNEESSLKGRFQRKKASPCISRSRIGGPALLPHFFELWDGRAPAARPISIQELQTTLFVRLLFFSVSRGSLIPSGPPSFQKPIFKFCFFLPKAAQLLFVPKGLPPPLYRLRALALRFLLIFRSVPCFSPRRSVVLDGA